MNEEIKKRIAPRDFHVDHRVGWVAAARIYSNFVSPPTMFPVLGLAVAWHALPTAEGLAWAAVYGFLVALLPILFVVYLLQTGRIAELHMTNRRERMWPYVSAVVGAAVAYGLGWAYGAPELLMCVILFNLIELSALAAITTVWLISMHSTAAMAVSVIAGLVWGGSVGLMLGIPLVISVSWVRLYLRRHTPGQVVAGLVLGALSVLVLVPFGCFV